MRIPMLIALAIMPLNAVAQSTDSALAAYQVSGDLGAVLAAAEPCGFTVNLDAIDKYAAEKISAENLGFANLLAQQTEMARYGLQNMSPDGLQLHCAAIRRSAEHYGFITP